MSRVQILGPRRLLPEALAFLQAEGVLEIRSPADDLAAVRPNGRPLLRRIPVAPEEAAAEKALASAIEAVEKLLAALPPVRSSPNVEEALPDPASPAFAERLEALAAELGTLEERRASLNEEREVVARYGRLLVALAPLRPWLPGDREPHSLGLVVRPDPEALALLRGELTRITGGRFDLQSRPVDDEHLAVLLTVPRSCAREVSALLFERGVEEVRLPSRYAGQPLVRALRLLLEREAQIPRELAKADARLSALGARACGPLRRAGRDARDRLARSRALAQCGETPHAFVLSGYVPSRRIAALESALARSFGRRVALVARHVRRGEEEEVPVVLENPPLLRPFERLLALVPMPRYGTTDPTPWLALFFPLFFGLILADVGFGVIALAVALAVRLRGWGGAAGRDLAAVALACAASAVVFGVLFGEAFGELGAHVGLRPLLLDRRRAYMTFLWIALGLGAVHVLLGMALGIADAARARHRRELAARTLRLAVILAAGVAGAAASGLLPPSLLRWALALLGALLAASIGVGGLLAPLELVLGLGNVLSYARLMALGLASVMLAEVANRLAGTVKPAAVGLALAILLHGVNFTLGLVSPVIASLRLHYVEFFEKFYEGGGRPYRPFALGT